MLNNEMFRNQLVTRRTFLIAAAKGVALSVLTGRLFYMQVMKSSEYQTLSDQNRISVIMLHPNRGNILDYTGKLLACNRPAFNVVLDAHLAKDYKKSLSILFKILNLTLEEQDDIYLKVKKYGLRFLLIIMSDISWQKVALIEEEIALLSGIYIDIASLRVYPYGYSASHLIGYSGLLNESEKRELGFNNIGYFNVGKSGLEKYYEDTLRGDFGVKKMEVNAYGMHVKELSTIPTTKGEDIVSNIHAELQQYVYNLLPPTGASAIIMCVDTGKVLTCTSSQGFDPNRFVGGISKDYWEELNKNHYKPLISRVTQSQYPPGSIFKIITVLAALENGLDPQIKVRCIGGASALGSEYFKCWNKSGHGEICMGDAIRVSCNCYMYHIAKTIGGEKILDLARRLGFGTQTGIDLPSEASGFVPSGKWKLRKLRSKWTLADSLNIAIGQGPLLMTPIQLAKLSTFIASNGILYTPKIIGAGHSDNSNVNVEHIRFLKQAMWDAINTPGGTAYSSRIDNSNWIMSGKTGTSQVQSKKGGIDLSSSSVNFDSRNHALFIGYVPSDKPKYAISIIVDHGGGGGGVAAPIAHDIVLELIKRTQSGELV